MAQVTAKKFLGQHFLKDKNIARKIVEALSQGSHTVLEVGPGTGMLTEILVEKIASPLYLVEVDEDLVAYLRGEYPSLRDRIIAADFLNLALFQFGRGPMAIIGNFPYNISSQIFFKVLEYRHQVYEVVGMVQKEVAQRLTARPGSKVYGVLSVLLQAFYDLEYLFTVGPQVFSPPPKVQSAVVRLRRNTTLCLDGDENLFFKVVKAAFQQRRKILNNALRPLLPAKKCIPPLLLNKRAEQLKVSDFVALTRYIASN